MKAKKAKKAVKSIVPVAESVIGRTYGASVDKLLLETEADVLKRIRYGFSILNPSPWVEREGEGDDVFYNIDNTVTIKPCTINRPSIRGPMPVNGYVVSIVNDGDAVEVGEYPTLRKATREAVLAYLGVRIDYFDSL